jgi:predicted metalloprotease
MTRSMFRTLILSLALLALAAAAALARPAGASARSTINWYDPVQAVNAFVPSINGYWNAVFRTYGRSYTAPAHIYWYGYDSDQGHVSADCDGNPLQEMNSFYCAADNSIYLGYPLLNQEIQQIGPYAAVAVLAHEWGHEAQRMLGWSAYAAQHSFFKGTELQADCYAGMYTRYAYDHTWLNAGNVSNARMTFAGLADGTDLNPYTASHGTAAQRVYWFNVGFNTQNLLQCNTVYHAVYGA